MTTFHEIGNRWTGSGTSNIVIGAGAAIMEQQVPGGPWVLIGYDRLANNCATDQSTVRVQIKNVGDQASGMYYVNIYIRSFGNYGAFFRLALIKNGTAVHRGIYHIPNTGLNFNVWSIQLPAEFHLVFGEWAGLQLQAVNDLDSEAEGFEIKKSHYNNTVPGSETFLVRSDNFGLINSTYKTIPYFTCTATPEGEILGLVPDTGSVCDVSPLTTQENVNAGGEGSDLPNLPNIPNTMIPAPGDTSSTVARSGSPAEINLGYLTLGILGVGLGVFIAWGTYELTKKKRRKN
ncbi:MAG: hypothetical protein FWH37_09075 [Candidatus Bathyarchaeota archaeon]|nr:hypothetical protein [Candidatus Termiticorpusculum sp.]